MEHGKYAALLAAVDLGNLTRAAERLGYTQSGMSYIIKALEEELGFPLLSRSRAGVRPTADCERLLPLLRDLDRRTRELEQTAAEIRGLTVGEVRLAVFPSISRFWLPDILRDFEAAYPGITVILREGGQEEVSGWLRSGAAELAFCTRQPDSPYQWVPFLDDDICAVVPEGHPLAALPELPLDLLRDEPFILEDSVYDTDIARALAAADFTPRHLRFSSMDEMAILAMVRAGLGVSVLPGLHLRGEHPGVAVLPLAPRAIRQLGAAAPDLGALSPAARRFLESAQKTMGVA